MMARKANDIANTILGLTIWCWIIAVITGLYASISWLKGSYYGAYRYSLAAALAGAAGIIAPRGNASHDDKNSKGGNVKLLGLPESSPNGKICGVHALRVLSPEAAQGIGRLAKMKPEPR